MILIQLTASRFLYKLSVNPEILNIWRELAFGWTGLFEETLLEGLPSA